MRAAVTGHTSGIGKGLFEDFKARGWDVTGLSRSNGYDINRDRKKVLDAILPCELFINNAQDGFAQTELLIDVFKHWQNQDKVIVNINSMGIRVDWPLEFHPWASPYRTQKVALDATVKQLQQTASRCFVTQITPGFVDTPLLPPAFANKRKLSVAHVVRMVNWVLETHKEIPVRELVIGEVR